MTYESLSSEDGLASVMPFRNPETDADPRLNQEVVYNPDLEIALVFNGISAEVDVRSHIYVGSDFRYGTYYWLLPDLQVTTSVEQLEFSIIALERSYPGLQVGDVIVRQLVGGEVKYELQRSNAQTKTLPFDIVVADSDSGKRFVLCTYNRLTFHKTYDFFTSYTENDPNTWRKGRRLSKIDRQSAVAVE